MAIRLQRATLYLRGDKKKSDGRMPLYVRFRRIDSEEPKFPIGIDLLTEKWDNDKQKASDPDVDLILQKEITRIREGAFYNGRNIKTVKFHERIEYIDGYAFTDCKNMELAVDKLPNYLKSIGDGAFTNCKKIL